MIEKKDYGIVQTQLQSLLAERFDDISVRIGDDVHYPGTNVVVTSPAFEDWLPEQRFHHVVRAVPPEFYDRYLQHGVVWFELAPGETGRDLMKMPRSEDVAADHDAILAQLEDIAFFAKFLAAMKDAPQDATIDDFKLARQIMIDGGLSTDDVTRACLFFISQGAFCDAQIRADVLPELGEKKGGKGIRLLYLGQPLE